MTDAEEQFEYDGNGNLTHHVRGSVERRFAFDYMNRLMRAEVTVDDETTVVDFKYDALGRRISRANGSAVTKYIYEGAQVVQELDAADAIVREYIWGDSIDELLGIRQSGQTYSVHENSIGSIAAITDSTGALVERYDYDVFGLPHITDITGTPHPDPTISFLGQPYSFQGREWDPVLRLFYFRARYYDAVLGRFIGQDAEQYKDSPNLYQAFLNSPANIDDPTGLKVGSVSGCDTTDPQRFYKCAAKQIGEDEALEMYYLLFDIRAQQLAPAIIQAGQAIEETMKIQAAILIAAGATGGAAGGLLGTETLLARLAACGIGGAGGQGMADLLNGELSDSGQYAETALQSMAGCLGIEGGIWGLRQVGLLKTSTAIVELP